MWLNRLFISIISPTVLALLKSIILSPYYSSAVLAEARYTIVKSAFRLFLGLTLAAVLLCGCGRGSSGPTVRPGTTDEMWGNEVDDAEIYAFMYEGRVYTADTIDEINPYDATPYMKDGGFYKLTASRDM